MSLPDAPNACVLIHDPRCSKSRAARVLLAERGVDVQERRYLDEPLGRAELQDLRRRLGHPPAEWIRSGEPAYREAGLSAASSESELLDAMARHPILIERPILVRGSRAVVGRPPERVLELL